jgi:choline dehydrogenase-like flavoprotein
VDTSVALAEAAGFEVLAKNYDPNPPGYSIHELGTCRMGDDPKASVLNKWNQSHDIKNLFVVDGAAFVGGGWQNPTMTVLALVMRSAEYLAEQMRQGQRLGSFLAAHRKIAPQQTCHPERGSLRRPQSKDLLLLLAAPDCSSISVVDR